MKFDAFKVTKIAVMVAAIGVSIAQTVISGKELDQKVAEKVAEALENE